MKTSQSKQKIYHDKRRKDLEFEEGYHVFFRVTPVIGVGRALNSRKLTPRFIGPYQILEKKYISDPSHVILIDDVQVRDKLTVEKLSVRIEDREMKNLRGKDISLVKICGCIDVIDVMECIETLGKMCIDDW
ncbi:uncharacterized protein LOC131650622 [Vicia villosa]|uniref:uncharacterized protein LOC131650622 n=1 Tax=Vicia villosa TaxID=3911 RepID=UPI00273ABCA1|nr:uncharacterized protein LOC131650622 [Vicia villosa]